MKNIGSVSIRRRERGLLIGGTGTGKSWLAEALLVDFHQRYERPRILVLDSKPRFRAEYEASGRSAARRYRSWSHGPVVAGSVAVNDPDDLQLAWSTGAAIVIAQDPNGAHDPRTLDAIANRYFDDARGNRAQLVVVDETMDFYRTNGSSIGGSNALLRLARAGRERGIAALYCSQRTRGIPAQLMEELTKLYLFRIDFRDDVKRLQEMGAPPDIAPPKGKYAFVYWTKADYERVYGPYTLEVPVKAG